MSRLPPFIRKNARSPIATATPATLATKRADCSNNSNCSSSTPPAAKAIRPQTVAGIATVAVAGAPDEYWLTFYEERAAIREYDGGLSRPDAEAGALQDTIAHWLASNTLTPGVPEDGCMHCASALPVDYRVAVLAGPGHAWLHTACLQEMTQARLALAWREVRRLLGFNNPDE